MLPQIDDAMQPYVSSLKPCVRQWQGSKEAPGGGIEIERGTRYVLYCMYDTGALIIPLVSPSQPVESQRHFEAN